MTVAIPAWKIIYGGTNITGNLIQHGARIDYWEGIGGKASHLEVSLEDASKAFQNTPPTAGTVVNLQIGYQGTSLVNCGMFEVDEWEFEGPPDVFILRCLQAGVTKALRSPKSKAWEGQTLGTIAQTIANNYGMTAVVDAVDPDVAYARLTQKTESDMGFLHRIANSHNYDFNVRGSQLVFYSRPSLEGVAPQGNAIEKTDCKRFRIHKQHLGHRSYKNAVVGYFNPQSKALVQSLVNAESSDGSFVASDTLHITERVENSQQANLKASAHLHTANMRQIQGEFTLPGTMLYRAGMTVNISGFGDFDTVKFIINSAKHSLTERGYYTVLTLRTVVAGTTTQQIISDEFQ